MILKGWARTGALCVMMLTSSACDSATFGGKTPAQMYDDPQVVALVDAVVAQDSAEVEALARQGANVNALPEGGATPLLWASYVDCRDCMRVLLRAGADPWLEIDVLGESVIELVISSERYAQLPMFIEAGVDLNHPVSKAKDVSLLGKLAFRGPIDEVKKLVAAGADINVQGATRFDNVVSMATSGGSYDTVLYLLQAGYSGNLDHVARGVETSLVNEEMEPNRQAVIAWLKERGVQYPPKRNTPAQE